MKTVKNAIKRIIRKTGAKLTGFSQDGTWRVAAVAALIFATGLPQGAQAGVFVKANNDSTWLNDSGCWTNNAVPGASDIAQWDSTYTSGRNGGASLQANLSWDSIRILNPGRDFAMWDSPVGAHSITLKSSGTAIDMSSAAKNFSTQTSLILATNQTWDVGAGRTLIVRPVSGSFSLNKAGAGTLAMHGTNTCSGATTVSAGTLNIDYSGCLLNTSGIAVSNTATLTIIGNNMINDAATVTLCGGILLNSAATTETIGTLAIGPGGQSTVNPSGTLTLTSLSHSGTGGTATLGGTGTIVASPALANGILGGWAVWGGTTSGQRGNAVTTNASGNLTYLSTFDKTYTATTSGINDWTLSQNIYFNPSSGTLTATLSADLSANSLTFLDINASPTLNLGGKTLTLTSGGIFYPFQNNGKNYTIQNGTLTAGTGTAPAELFITSANWNYRYYSTISAAISNNNGQAVSVVQHANPGAAVGNLLSGNNGYSGGTYINNGYIFINNDYNLGAVNGAVYFQGGSLGIRSTMTLNASRDLVAAANAAATIDTYVTSTISAALVTTIAGKVTGAGSFAKTGTYPQGGLDTGPLAGTVILTNPNNNWAGATTVSAGILQIGDGTTTAGSIPDRAVSLSGACTTLKFANPTASSFNSVISGSGDLIKTGAGTLTLGGVNTYSNGTTISGGTLAIASDVALGVAYDGSVSGATVTNWGSGYAQGGATWALTFAAPPSGTTASGSFYGYWPCGYVTSLTGGSGYVAPPAVAMNGTGTGGGIKAYVKGLLTLDGGTLQTTAGITSSRAVLITTNNGAIDTAGNNSTFSGVFNGPGRLTKTGAGTLALNGINTFTGGTTVSDGTLGGTGTVAGVVTNLATITAADTNSIGTLNVSNLVMAANSTYAWNYNGATQDLIQVTGTLTLPTVATVNVSQVISGTLPNPAVLFTFTTGAGAAAANGTLGSWVINGAPPSTRIRVLNNQVIMDKPLGTLISFF